MANETGAVIRRNATRDIVSVTVPDLSGIYATQTDLGDVETFAAEKATVYSLPSSTPPTPPEGGFAIGDLWFKTDLQNEVYVWDGDSWVSMRDLAIIDAQNTADGKAAVFVQDTPPTAYNVNDIWVDTANGNILKVWDGSAWIPKQDADIATALANAADAISAAASAQATADGKVTTFFQTTAPTAEGVGDLWIDTDNGNALSRWSGSAWVAVQDAGIAQAITDAATAQATADGKIVSFYQPGAPTATSVGDFWIDTDDNNKLYRWSGTAWVSVRDGSFQPSITGGTGEKLFHNVLSYNNSTGSLAGNIVIDTPITFGNYMTHIGVTGFNYRTNANNISFQVGFYAYSTGPAFVNTGTVVYGSMPVTVRLARKTSTGTVSIILSPNDGTGLWQYPKINIPLAEIGHTTPPDTFLVGWSASVVAEASLAASYDLVSTPPLRDTLGEITDAQDSATAAQTTADGKNTVFYQASAPTANKVNDLWFDTDDGNKPYKWSGSTWVAATFGDSAIAGLNVGKLVSGEIAVGESIIAGPSSGTHAEMSDTGFYAYVEDPDGGAPNEAVRIGTDTGDLLSVPDPATGATLGSINQEGIGSFQGVSVAGTDTDGDGTPDSGLVIYGTEFSDWVSGKSGGTLAQGIYTTDFTSGPITTEFGIAELSYFVDPARSYIFIFPGVYWSWQGTKSSAVFGLRYTTDGSTPSITSTLWDTVNCIGDDTENHWYSSYPMILEGGWNVSPGVPVRILVTVRRGYGVGTVKWGIDAAGSAFPRKYPRLILLDSGEQTPETWIGNDGGGTAAPTKQNYVKTYRSTSSATYQGDGSKRTDTTDVVQGYNSFNGDGKGLWIFPSMTSDLSGATVNKVEIYAYANHWYYNSGGSALIKVHGYTSAPASSPSMTTAITSANWPKPGGRWVTLPSSLYAGFKSGTYRGFGMGPASTTNLLYYGRFNGGTGALIRVSYTK